MTTAARKTCLALIQTNRHTSSLMRRETHNTVNPGRAFGPTFVVTVVVICVAVSGQPERGLFGCGAGLS